MEMVGGKIIIKNDEKAKEFISILLNNEYDLHIYKIGDDLLKISYAKNEHI